MKLPEYLLSTPRLIAIIITIALVYLTILGKVESKDFVAIATLIFGYFFGSRGSEKAEGKTDTELMHQNQAENQNDNQSKPIFDINLPPDYPQQ